MPGIPKIVTFTPLIRPEARSSPSPSLPKHDLRLVPQKAPKTSVSPALHELFWKPQTSDTDVWAHFSNSEGFHDENGFYYPPMDPEEIRQFAEKYFSSPEFYSSPIEFDQDLLSDLGQDSLISDLMSESNAGYSSSPQLDFLNEHLNSTFPISDVEEQLDLFLSDTHWPLPLDTTTTEAPASGDTLLANESSSTVEGADMAMDTSI